MGQQTQTRRHKSTLKDLGDFTTTFRVVPIMLMAIVHWRDWCIRCVVFAQTDRLLYKCFLLSPA